MGRGSFKGWYFKFQTKEGRALAVIPAFHRDSGGRGTASLQIITQDRSWWLDYPGEAFHTTKGRFLVRLGESRFHDQGVSLQIQREGITLTGQLRFGPLTALDTPIMGPFRFLGGMECSHEVVSMSHALTGTLTLNGAVYDFTGGVGYIEGDRGRSFPSRYLWAQCTWQGTEPGSLMLAIAAIPLAGLRFTGCLCALCHQGEEYRLATYRGVHLLSWSERGAVLRQGRRRLVLELLEQQAQPLKAPVEGDMGRTIHESLCAHVRFRFWEGERLLLDHTDTCAGFEYAG